GRDITPSHRLSHLFGVFHRLFVEDAERLQGSETPWRNRLDWIVDRGVHMSADKLRSHFTAALVRNVSEFRAGGLLDPGGNDLVLLLGTCPSHLEGTRTPLLHLIDIFLSGLRRVTGIHPKHKLSQRQHGDGGEILPTERYAGGQRRREQVG